MGTSLDVEQSAKDVLIMLDPDDVLTWRLRYALLEADVMRTTGSMMERIGGLAAENRLLTDTVTQQTAALKSTQEALHRALAEGSRLSVLLVGATQEIAALRGAAPAMTYDIPRSVAERDPGEVWP